MRISAFIGLFAGALFVVNALDLVPIELGDANMILLVLGGGIAWTLVAVGLGPLLDALRAVRFVFVSTSDGPKELIGRLFAYSNVARSNGLLHLEQDIQSEPNPILSEGIRLMVDGAEPGIIMDILETELNFNGERQTRLERILERLGQYWMLFAGLGALFVLVEGGNIAMAGTPLIYGFFLWGLASAMAYGVSQYYASERLLGLMSIEGINALQAGDHPLIVKHKLSVFIASRDRRAVDALSLPAPEPTPSIATSEIDHCIELGREGMIAAVREAIEQGDREKEEKREALDVLNQVDQGVLNIRAFLSVLGPDLSEVAYNALKEPPQPPPPLIQSQMPGGLLLKNQWTFDELAALEDERVRALLREIDQRDAVVALKGANERVKEKIFGNMSERVCAFIKEEIGYARCDLHDVLEAQTRIVRQMNMMFERSEEGGV
jgi:chemotaxis protein MotA